MFSLSVAPASAQGTKADYDRAAGLRARWTGKLEVFRPKIGWLPDGAGVWWSLDGGKFVRVDSRTGERRFGTKAELGLATEPVSLEPKESWSASPSSGEETSITFENRLKRRVRLFWADQSGRPQQYGELQPGETREQHTFAGHVWLADFEADDLAGVFVAEAMPSVAVFDTRSRRVAKSPRRRGDRRVRGVKVTVRDHNLFVEDESRNKDALTLDGYEEDSYDAPRKTSPDGKRVLGFRVRPGESRRIPLLESAPKDQVQPKLQWRDYLKPGDRIAQWRPRLFDLEKLEPIPVDDAPFADSWRVDRVHWAADSSRVFCIYNRRGHQEFAVRSIDARTGRVRDVVKESSETFVDYSQKTWMHWLDDEDQLLWMSERDGWNHLYRFDTKRCRLVNRITTGDWVVRRVEFVDEKAGQIWFTAFGIHPDQDPYHAHLARVDFDGKNLVVITASDGNHKWTLSPDRSLALVRWSRVDHPAVTELRRTRDGSLVAELGRDDASELLAAGFSFPQRFVTKGRDGTTDIHGYMIRPSNFDPTVRYPVIERIYAGPHGHHVGKSFGLAMRDRELAELGFLVARIDGMGTNWRSKAFHDVCWQNLRDAGLPDRIAWLRAYAAQHGGADLDRVGIFGGSAGGQNALSALLHHGAFYKAAAADCGCHDNRMDKIWWNEAWMGEMGPHYAENSNVTHAEKLQGKLLLTVGELDKNVDPASTMQVVDALLRAGKDFDLIVVPGAGHGVGERPDMVRRRSDFFVRALYGAEPRRP